MTLQKLLQVELARRQGRNPRYSLRAFARDLALHHATLSRVMRGRTRAKPVTLAAIAARLRLSPDIVLRSALADADAAVLATVRRADFRPESRRIAELCGLSLDEVNAALQRLLRRRMLSMISTRRWEAVPERK